LGALNPLSTGRTYVDNFEGFSAKFRAGGL